MQLSVDPRESPAKFPRKCPGIRLRFADRIGSRTMRGWLRERMRTMRPAEGRLDVMASRVSATAKILALRRMPFPLSPWVTAAVVVLMVSQTNLRGVCQKRDVFQKVKTHLSVLLHMFPLSAVRDPGLRSIPSGIPNFPISCRSAPLARLPICLSEQDIARAISIE
jgi:hypothetical protein